MPLRLPRPAACLIAIGAMSTADYISHVTFRLIELRGLFRTEPPAQ